MDFTLIRSKRKTISLQVKGDEIVVRAPMRASQKAIIAFVDSHRDWIEKQKKKEEEKNKRLSAVQPLSQEEVKALALAAKEYFPPVIRRYASMMHIEYGKVTIRCQKSRWGSCSTKKNLNFNCLLMLAPEEVRESVVVHELCHLKEMNHSHRFYEEVYRYCPDYDRLNVWLRENGPCILQRAFPKA
ncbi:MAG: M48 family metallopeptidase [Ruminococcus sp.]|nr:M48 family metallopeptidase [Ruminococcus sp.]